jgi:hypothetical protein
MTLAKVQFQKIKEGEIKAIKFIEDENALIIVLRNGFWRKFDYKSTLVSPAYEFEEEIVDVAYCSLEKILVMIGSIDCRMYQMKRTVPKLVLTISNTAT